jgi:hypothetical protein
MNVSEQVNTTAEAATPQTPEDKFSPERVAARIAQFERWQALLAQGNSTSGRNGRPWREWINDHEE